MRSPAPAGSPHAYDAHGGTPHSADTHARPSLPFPSRELLAQDRENRDFVYNLGFAVSVLEEMVVKFETTTRAKLAELNNKAARLERLLTYVEFAVSGGVPPDAQLPFPTPPASPVASLHMQRSAASSPRLGVSPRVPLPIPHEVRTTGSHRHDASPRARTHSTSPRHPKDASPRRDRDLSPRHRKDVSPSRARDASSHRDRDRDSVHRRSKDRSDRPASRSRSRSEPVEVDARTRHSRVHSSSPARSSPPKRQSPAREEQHVGSSRRHGGSSSRGRRTVTDDLKESELDQGEARRSPRAVRDSYTVNSSFQDWRPVAAAAGSSSTPDPVAVRSSRMDELVPMDSDDEDSPPSMPIKQEPDTPQRPQLTPIPEQQWVRTMDNALYESVAVSQHSQRDTPSSDEGATSLHITPLSAAVSAAASAAASSARHPAASTARGAPDGRAGGADSVGPRQLFAEQEQTAAAAAAADLSGRLGQLDLASSDAKASPAAAATGEELPQTVEAWQQQLRQARLGSGAGATTPSSTVEAGRQTSLAVNTLPGELGHHIRPPVAPRLPELQHAGPGGLANADEDEDNASLPSQSSPMDPEGPSLPDTGTYARPAHQHHLQTTARHEDQAREYGDMMLPLPHFLETTTPSPSHASMASVAPSTLTQELPPGVDEQPEASLRQEHYYGAAAWQPQRTGESPLTARSGSVGSATAAVERLMDEHLQCVADLDYGPHLPRPDDHWPDSESSSFVAAVPRVRTPLTASQGG